MSKKTIIKTEIKRIEKNEHFEALASCFFGMPFEQLIKDMEKNKGGKYDRFCAKNKIVKGGTSYEKI